MSTPHFNPANTVVTSHASTCADCGEAVQYHSTATRGWWAHKTTEKHADHGANPVSKLPDHTLVETMRAWDERVEEAVTAEPFDRRAFDVAVAAQIALEAEHDTRTFTKAV